MSRLQSRHTVSRPALGRRVGAGLAVWLGLSGGIVMALFLGAPAPGAAGHLPEIAARFQFEQQARNHCPGEAIVWVDARSQTYDAGTDRFYGRTRTGAFACRRDAETAGYHASRGP